MKLGRLFARLVMGGLFIGHGTQKWFGWFGGPGIEATEGMMDSIEMRPAKANAHLVAATESVGGAMIAAGALTPFAASGLIAAMVTAIRKVHLEKGPWVAEGGYEFNLLMIAGLVAVVDSGPGPLSVDSALGIERTGPAWAAFAIAAGAIGSTAAIEAGRRAGQASGGEEPEPGVAEQKADQPVSASA